jgi:hypothetical protein
MRTSKETSGVEAGKGKVREQIYRTLLTSGQAVLVRDRV